MMLSISQIKKQLLHNIPSQAKWLGGFAALALCIKIVLQELSVIPSLNQLVFGFRPIVIGYLHLVFLGIVTLFIFAYGIQKQYVVITKTTRNAIYAFAAGVIFNEALLMVQSLGALLYVNIPLVNQLLLAAALLMFFAAFMMAFCQFRLTTKAVLFVSNFK